MGTRMARAHREQKLRVVSFALTANGELHGLSVADKASAALILGSQEISY